MEIDPYLQLTMLLSAFLCGVALGALWEVVTALRIVLGAYQAPECMRKRYERPLPLLRRPIPWPKGNAARRVWRGVLIGVGDFLFCLLFALVAELLLYRFNDGAFRVSVPLLALAGLGLFRVSIARITGLLVAWMAYGFAALWMYLTALLKLPICGLQILARRFLYTPVRRVRRAWLAKASARLFRAQLTLAENGFQKERMPTNVSKKKTARKQKNAVDYRAPGGSDLSCGSGDHGRTLDGVSSKAAV